MTNIKPENSLKYLLYMPAFYGALTWGAWLLLYLLKLIRIDDCSGFAMVIFLSVEFLFIIASIISIPYYKSVVDCLQSSDAVKAVDADLKSDRQIKILLLALHGIGFAGLLKYVKDFSENLGGVSGFLFALLNEAESIRIEAATARSVGTQLSYIGWIAIGMTVYYLAGKRISKYWWVPVLLQFAGNLMFIDRTRPLTIFFTAMLMMLITVKTVNLKKVMLWTSGAVLFVLLTFWLVAEWSGKTFYKGMDESSVLPGITQDIYLYGVSGFAYFNYMLQNKQEISYAPHRLFYPVNKVLSGFGLIPEPPSPITEFYNVPFTTNVGTFLEPLYRDGGLFFVVLGMFLHSFGLNLLCLPLLRSRAPAAYYAWATICFTTFIAFFVPKISFFGTWLFIAIGLAVLFFRKVQARLIDYQQSEIREKA